MSEGRSPKDAQNHLSGERRKSLSITHHALSPPPSHHHLYIIHLINWLQRFYRITMSLKRPFVPKSDIKQWFTTTTTNWPDTSDQQTYCYATFVITFFPCVDVFYGLSYACITPNMLCSVPTTHRKHILTCRHLTTHVSACTPPHCMACSEFCKLKTSLSAGIISRRSIIW